MSCWSLSMSGSGETGVSPSFDEMKEALDLKSKSGIHRLITALEERGFIRRLPHRARALEVLQMPEGMTAEAKAAAATTRISSRCGRRKFPPLASIPAPASAGRSFRGPVRLSRWRRFTAGAWPHRRGARQSRRSSMKSTALPRPKPFLAAASISS